VRPFDPRLMRYAGAARGYLACTIVLGLAATGLILAQAGLLADVLADAIRGTRAGTLAGLLAALGVVLAARAAASYGTEVAALRAAARVKSQLRRALTAHVLRLGPSWLSDQRPGEMATLSTKGLDALDPYFARYLPQLVLACVVPVAVVIRVAFADWISALVIALTLPLIPVFAVLIGMHTKAQTERQWRLLAQLGGHFLDVVEGLTTLKVFGRSRAQAQVIGEVTDQHRRATMTTLRVAFLSALVLELAATIATALVAVEVGLRLLAGHLDYRTALLVLILTPEAYLPLRNVGTQFHASMEGATAASQVFEILGAEPSRVTGAQPDTTIPVAAPAARRRPADLCRDVIRLRDVTLRYPGRDLAALSEVSMMIRPGEHIAITGPSGAGKSSLLALLLRFAEPTAGVIEVGRHALGQIPATQWRGQLAWVPQHPHLFTASIAENIALGRPGASQGDIERAAMLAGASEFIEDLPLRYATAVGERGVRLSSGQRQRIALARAFLVDAPLLLLDEPTAHLDPFSARELEMALARLMADRTVLQVTHDTAVADSCDRVVGFECGRLVGQIEPLAATAPVPALAIAASGPAVTR
jgi:ATP-binding cassette, subfamily C, bacterial CydD